MSGKIEEMVTCSMISSTRPAFTASGLIMSTDTSFLVGTGEEEGEEEGEGEEEEEGDEGVRVRREVIPDQSLA